MKTILKSYYFNTTDPKDRREYEALRASLSETNGKCFRTWGAGPGHYNSAWLDGVEVELETKHLFDNQWNTAPFNGESRGRRVFDWAEDYPIDFPKTLKRGHYLVITDEMREIRRNTNACGYCGHQEEAQRGLVFCNRCLGSEYLHEKDLRLLRMRAIDQSREADGRHRDRPPLTEAERAYLIPLWKEAQFAITSKRGAEQRGKIEAKCERAIASAKIERDGFIWLLDHGVSIENVIFYEHTGRFHFGWRSNGLDPALVSDLLEKITEFPFAYDISTADGRKLSAER